MKISERIKSLFRRQPPTAEELAARTEAEGIRDQMRQDQAVLKSQVGPGFGPGSLSSSVVPPTSTAKRRPERANDD